MLDAKYTSEAVKARLSIDHSANKVAEGQRWAAKEEEYLLSVQEYTKLKKTYEYLDVCFSVLKDIAWQSYDIYSTANKREVK